MADTAQRSSSSSGGGDSSRSKRVRVDDPEGAAVAVDEADAPRWRGGGCHCRSVRFRVLVPRRVDVYRCNCTICHMRQNHHFVVTPDRIKFGHGPRPGDPGDPGDPGASSAASGVGVGVGSSSSSSSVGAGGGSGAGHVSEYRFRTKVARHTFCSTCGVTSYYTPRSNPDGYAVTLYCMDDYQPGREVLIPTFHDFDGQNWEAQIKTSSITAKTDQGGGGHLEVEAEANV